MSGGITRLKQHLTHTKGDVAGCSKVTTDITKRVLAPMHEKEKITKEKKRNIEILRSANTIDLSEVEDADDENLKMVDWKKFALEAYNIGLTFQCRKVTRAFKFMIYVEKYGMRKGRCLINFLVNCPTGTIFLKSIDASEHVKDAQLIVKMINEVIEDVGEENILQFITDNGSNFKVAGVILEEQHPKLFWTPCAAHCVNLMIGDIGEKIPKIKSALSDARAVVVYIYNHGRILNMMRKLTKNKELHRSCVTRFATQFYTLKSVHENRHHLQVLFVSEQWTKSNFAKKVVGKRVERIVAKQEVWDNVYLACQVLAPLVNLVWLVDTEEKPCMGYIYDTISRAKEQISKNLKDLYVAIDRLVPDPDENDSSNVREAIGGYVNIGPSTRSKRERYRDDDDEISVGGGLEEEVNALDDLDSDAEPLDYN
ncbi:hypothetical protein Tco_0156621 [Tanacetum coccineum]